VDAELTGSFAIVVEYGESTGRPRLRFLVQSEFGHTHELGCWDFQQFGQLEDCPKRGALDTTFEQANIRPVKAALQRQCFLRKATLTPDLPEGLTEGSLRAG
jgi:hypothetical protein